MSNKPITFEEIVSNNEQFSAISETEFEKIMDKFDKEQPHLAEFLWNEFAEELSDETTEFLYFVGIQIWYILSKKNKNLSLVTEDAIAQALKKNEEMLDYVHGLEDADDFADFFKTTTENHIEPDMFSYIVNLAYDYGKEDEDNEEEQDNPYLQMPVYEEDMEIEDYESIARDMALVAYKTVLDTLVG